MDLTALLKSMEASGVFAQLRRENTLPDGNFGKRLHDGTIGYYVRMPRTDDCFQAAVATVLQVPINEVPDSRIDERLAAGWSPDKIDRSARKALDAWLAGRGLRMVFHDRLPVAEPRWIGVVPLPGAFNDHSLVISRGELLFDPTMDWGDVRLRLFGLRDVGHGISFLRLPKTYPHAKRGDT
jgi:hypothetical protein